jgi:hypothetical protein
MKKNLPLLIILSLLCVYVLLTFQKPEFTLKGPPSDLDWAKFFSFAKDSWLFASVVLFTFLVFSPTGNRNEVKQPPPSVWLSGVFTLLGIIILPGVIFNPSGAFTWNIDNVVNKDTRLIKPYLYDRLNSAPDIVFMGTSISHRIRAQDYARRLALTGFNFSTLGGTTVDYFTITGFIMSKPIADKKPAVLVTEILSPSLGPSHAGVEFYKRYPLEYIKYMAPKFAFKTISTHLERILTYASLSQIMYVGFFTWRGQWIGVSNEPSDGTGIRIPPIGNEANYRKSMIKSSKSLDKLLQCSDLNTDGQNAILKIVALSKGQHTSVVFYRSPINNDFYTLKSNKRKQYNFCEEKFNQFMQQIQKENPNVFYTDLSHYAPIASGGKDLYLDSHHLNSVGSEHLLKVLTPLIKSAVEYARTGKINPNKLSSP